MYEMGFKNFEENLILLDLEDFNLKRVLEIILDKPTYSALAPYLRAYKKNETPKDPTVKTPYPRSADD
jgi:hypothetical protein